MACYSWSVEPRDYLPKSWINPTVRLYKHTFMLIILAQGDIRFACCGTGSRPRPTLKFNHSPSSLERPWLSPLSSSMLAQVQSKRLCCLLLFPHLPLWEMLRLLILPFPHSVPQLVLRSLTVVTGERQLSMVARMAAPARTTLHLPTFFICALCPVPWTHPVTVMAVTSLLLTKLTLPTAT